jgi:hypothetical protein
MGKIRIYELARELNMTNKQLLEKLEELGIPVKSHMSSVEDAEVESIKDKIRGKKQPDLVEKRIRPSVIRRRRVKAPAEPAPVAVEPADDQVDDQRYGAQQRGDHRPRVGRPVARRLFWRRRRSMGRFLPGRVAAGLVSTSSLLPDHWKTRSAKPPRAGLQAMILLCIF